MKRFVPRSVGSDHSVERDQQLAHAGRYVSRHFNLNKAATSACTALRAGGAMRLRRCTVEHPFAALKYQIFEKPRFLLGGLHGAGTEMALATLAYKRALSVLGHSP